MGDLRRLILAAAMVLSGSVLFAADKVVEGIEYCAEKAPAGAAPQELCYAKWETSLELVQRYLQHNGVLDEYGDMTMPSLADAFIWNPFRINPRQVFDSCSSFQVFNGNVFTGGLDYPALWECIRGRDKSVAGWGAI